MLPFICSVVNDNCRVDAIIVQCVCSVKYLCAVYAQCMSGISAVFCSMSRDLSSVAHFLEQHGQDGWR